MTLYFNRLQKQQNTWKWGLLCLVFLAPFFFLTYGFSNQYAASLVDVPSFVFDWESHIPLWPWTIIPYWSIDLFYGLAILLCWNKFELRQTVLRLFTAQIIAVCLFLLFPLKFSFIRPELDGFFGLWFNILMGFDQPYNQAPSLHIILLVILWDFYRRHVSSYWKVIVDLWSFLIGLSVLTTWQHHFIDVPAGILVGAICLWLFPLTVRSPFRADLNSQMTRQHFKMGSLYFVGAVFLLSNAYYFKSWALWLLYPAFSLFFVALAYFLNRVHFFQKQDHGKMTIASMIIFAPYFLFAWLNSRIWTQKHPEDSAILSIENTQIFLGRAPSHQHTLNYQQLFDCCAEIAVTHSANDPYYYSLDLIPLNAQQLNIASQRLNTLYTELQDQQKILIFCALGYSRSSAVLAAWLIRQGYAVNATAAINMIRKARPWIVLKPQQMHQLEIFQANLAQYPLQG